MGGRDPFSAAPTLSSALACLVDLNGQGTHVCCGRRAGLLALPAYAELLKQSVKDYQTRAVAYKKAGRDADARLLLARIKLMETEITQLESLPEDEE